MTYFQQKNAAIATPHPTTIGIKPLLWVELTDGDFTIATGVDFLRDKSGNGNNGAQSIAAEQPAVGIVNGKSVMSFDGIDDCIDFAAVYGTEAEWLIVAEKAVPVSPEYIMAGNAPAGSPFFITGFDPGGGVEDFEFEIADTDPSEYRFSLKTIATAGLHILGASHVDGGGAGGAKGYFDGVQVQSIDPGTTDLNSSTFVRLGCAFPSLNHYGQDIPGFLIYDPILSTFQRSKINKFLKNRWGTP